jgi:hypothetical protein
VGVLYSKIGKRHLKAQKVYTYNHPRNATISESCGWNMHQTRGVHLKGCEHVRAS